MKYLHAMVRVRDLDASLHFFRDALGLVETRRSDHPQGRFTNRDNPTIADIARDGVPYFVVGSVVFNNNLSLRW